MDCKNVGESGKYKITGDRNKGNTISLLLKLDKVFPPSSVFNSTFRCSHGYQKCNECTLKETKAHIDLKTKKHTLGMPSLFTFQAKIVSYDMIINDGIDLLKIHVYVRFETGSQDRHLVSISSKHLMLNRFYNVDPEDDSWHAIYLSKSWVDPKTWKFDLDVALVTESDSEPNKKVNQLTAGRLAMALYDDEGTTDVELVGFDGTVRAHGSVLAAASPVMRSAYYDCAMSEQRERRLRVPDASVHTLRLIKQYAYKGFVDAAPAELVSVLPVASRFMLDGLVLACTAALTELPPDDLIPLLRLDYTATKSTQEDAKEDCEVTNAKNTALDCEDTNTLTARRISKRRRVKEPKCSNDDNSLE